MGYAGQENASILANLKLELLLLVLVFNKLKVGVVL